jgi:RimJ/RimL family protein N-acetyltransferase
MKDIRINSPGAGDWIMGHLHAGKFTPGWDNSFSSHEGDRILGGIVLTCYLGGSMTAHMASQDKRWFSRELAWLTFHYAFEQLGIHKMLAALESDNHKILAMDMRGGWQLEATIRDAYGLGRHMLILSMTKDTCPWLRYKSKLWQPLNREAA